VPALLLDFVVASLIRGDQSGEQILAEMVDALIQTEAGNQKQFLRIGTLLATVGFDRQPIMIQAKYSQFN
jgi:predicted methyltransferase MtxX (methanogen marker protein 4)